MLLPLLVMDQRVAKTTGLSRTHGEPDGERKVTSESLIMDLEMVSAVFTP